MVRNCRDIGENLQKIMNRLISNDKLVKLLYYPSINPLSESDLSEQEKKDKIFNKLIKIIPRVGPKLNSQSVIAISISKGSRIPDNTEFKEIEITIESFVPLNTWIINDTNLRPFAILGEIQDSLNNKTVNGLGKMVGGDFELKFLTDEISCYQQTFYIENYD